MQQSSQPLDLFVNCSLLTMDSRGTPPHVRWEAPRLLPLEALPARHRALPYLTHRWHIYIEQPQDRRSAFMMGCAVLCKAFLTTYGSTLLTCCPINQSLHRGRPFARLRGMYRNGSCPGRLVSSGKVAGFFDILCLVRGPIVSKLKTRFFPQPVCCSLSGA